MLQSKTNSVVWSCLSLVLLLSSATLILASQRSDSDANGGVAEAKGSRPEREATPILLEAPELQVEALPDAQLRNQVRPVVGSVAVSAADRTRALNKAVANGDVASVEKALRAGADPNALSLEAIPTIIAGVNGTAIEDLGDEVMQFSTVAPGAPALFRAVALPGPEAIAITKQLLNADAFVNAHAPITASADSEDIQDLSVLALALLNQMNPGYLELISLLRARGAEIDNNAQMILDIALSSAISDSNLPTTYLQALI
ncbi:MAG TPA: hypothetical protein VJJ83_03340, partial [Candidatus Babeliales bacterium]|nr:hypothetical protein [Candidatus Babeliales bacterium]